MPKEGLHLYDPITGEPTLIPYDEIDPELHSKLLVPVGGFCYEAEAFVRLPLPPVPFYVKDWIPKQGKAEIYGQDKVGKSFMSLQLARCVGAGEDFLGIPTTKATVLYLQFEMGEEVLQGRIRATGKNYPNVYIGTSFAMKLDASAGKGQLWTALEAVRPQLLIVDPFYKVISGDENESKDMKVLTDFFDSLIDQFHCSLLIIHHAGKDLTKGGRGSSILSGWVDSCIELKRLSGGDTSELRVALTPKLLRHAELPPEPKTCVLGKDFEFYETGGLPTVLDKIITYLKDKGHAQAGKLITEKLGSRKQIYECLSKLVERGQAQKKGLDYYWTGKTNERLA